MQSQVAKGPVLSGQIPSLAGPYVRRKETGLVAADLPAGETTVLLPAQDQASGLGWLGGSGRYPPERSGSPARRETPSRGRARRTAA